MSNSFSYRYPGASLWIPCLQHKAYRFCLLHVTCKVFVPDSFQALQAISCCIQTSCFLATMLAINSEQFAVYIIYDGNKLLYTSFMLSGHNVGNCT